MTPGPWWPLARLRRLLGRCPGETAGTVPHEGEAQARQREVIERSGKLAEMGRIAAGVAHELRNPLLVIDGRLQLLESQIADGQIVATPTLVNHLAKMAEAPSG